MEQQFIIALVIGLACTQNVCASGMRAAFIQLTSFTSQPYKMAVTLNHQDSVLFYF